MVCLSFLTPFIWRHCSTKSTGVTAPEPLGVHLWGVHPIADSKQPADVYRGLTARLYVPRRLTEAGMTK